MKTKKEKKRGTLGTGLSAKCVVTPALKCKTSKNRDLRKRVSKIVQEPDSDILREIFEREIVTSTLIKSNPDKDLVDRFIVIDHLCQLDLSINKTREKFLNENCGLESGVKYNLLNMYNGACTTNNNNSAKSKICGNLANYETCKFLANGKKFKNLVRYLIEAVEFLHTMDVAHCDIKPLNLLCDENGVVRFIDFGSSLFLKDVVNGEKEFVSMCSDLNKIISEKSSIFNTREQFYNKVAAITPKYTPTEVFTSRSILNKPDILFSQIYMELILNLNYKNTNELQRLVKRYHKSGNKVLSDLFCRKNPMIYKWDVFSLGRTIADIYFVGKKTTKLPNGLNDLVNKMTEIDYKKRITIKQALEHPYLN